MFFYRSHVIKDPSLVMPSVLEDGSHMSSVIASAVALPATLTISKPQVKWQDECTELIILHEIDSDARCMTISLPYKVV